MKAVRARVWICLGVGALLVALCFLGESQAGQRYLIGKPVQDHWAADDQAMGAGLAPIVYCLIPGVILIAMSCVLYFLDRRRHRSAGH